MKDHFTPLDTGIFVKIDPIQYELLKIKSGFLEKNNYPDEWKPICVKGELGRFLFFRFIEDPSCLL